MNQIDHAPVVFFGFNRARHATDALESLKACPEIAETPVIIYMDGPRNEADVPAVDEARAAVAAVAPDHARIILRDENLGLANSIRAGVSAACEEYGQVIVVEDDLVLSPVALTYFNRALAHFRDDDRVMHIAGFWPDTGMELDPTFFLRWPSVWGWATWDRAWSQLEWDLEVLRDEIDARNLVERFNEGGWDFYGQLIGTLDGEYDSWGIRWYASVLLNEGLALHPSHSLVANTGTDGSGVHGDESTEFGVDLGFTVPPFTNEVVESSTAVEAWTAFNDRFNYEPLWKRVLRRARRVLGRVLRR